MKNIMIQYISIFSDRIRILLSNLSEKISKQEKFQDILHYFIIFPKRILLSFGKYLTPVYFLLKKIPASVWIGVLPAVAFSLYSMKSSDSSKKKESESEEKIRTLILKKEEFFYEKESAGKIQSCEKAELHFRAQGRISVIFKSVGDAVKKGEKLATLETYPLLLEKKKASAHLASAQAKTLLASEKLQKAKKLVLNRMLEQDKQRENLRRAKAEFEKFQNSFRAKENLFQSDALSDEDLSQSRLDLQNRETIYKNTEKDLEMTSVGLNDEDIISSGRNIPKDTAEKKRILQEINTGPEISELKAMQYEESAARTMLEIIEMNLREAEIISPIDGTVTKKDKNVGELVNGNIQNPVFIVEKLDNVCGIFSVGEKESSFFRQNTAVKVSADAYPGEVFTGSIERISPVFEEKTHTVEIRTVLENRALRLRPGMFIRIKSNLGKSDILFKIPRTSVFDEKSGIAKVFLKKDGKAFSREIRTSGTEKGNISVTSGLTEGEEIILEPGRLKEGEKL